MSQSQVVRANIKPETIERLSKYAKVRLGMGIDDLVNDALNSLEERLTSPKATNGERKNR